jgi:hypothetical protein
MGKSLLIITLGISLIISFIILKLNTNATQGVETAVNKFDQTHARLIANSAVEILLEKLRKDKNLRGTFSGNLIDGTYSGSITGPDNDIVVRSIGKFQGVEHKVVVEATRYNINPPGLKGAMTISTPNLNYANINGSTVIDGHDYSYVSNPDKLSDKDWPKYENPSGEDVPGIALDDMDQVSQIDILKPNMVVGSSQFGPTGQTFPWVGLSNDYAFSADQTITESGEIKKVSFGSINAPKITLINSQGTVKINGGSGAGVLIVNGDLELAGNFIFFGIVIVYKSANIIVDDGGTPIILGGMVIAGPEVSLGNPGFGNSQIRYSSETLSNVFSNLESSRFKILSWWE